MTSLLTFEGRTSRPTYALASFGVFVAQYALVVAAFAEFQQPLTHDWRFYVMPLRSLVELKGIPLAALPLAFGLTIFCMWWLGALAFRRATDAGLGGWIAALAMVPVIQVFAIVFLCAAPSRPATVAEALPSGSDWRTAAQGIIAGAILTLFAVAVGALVFGTYGFGMFVIAPLMIGATTAFLANRKGDLGWRRTAYLILEALLLGATGLVVGALEGVVCIVLAAPLAYGAALIGGALGRAIALSGNRSTKGTLMSVAVLPLVFASENVLPVHTDFDTTESIEIAAQPHAVWLAIIRMKPITAPLALPFRLGVAYPLGGQVIGEGIGATRKGLFSTGTASERVTEWEANRKMTLTVLSDPPAMHELSPYEHVNAPHVRGYFRTTTMSFEIVAAGRDHCRVIEHTSHELQLDPVLYWLPFARWIVHENNMRVLTHIRDQAINQSSG